MKKITLSLLAAFVFTAILSYAVAEPPKIRPRSPKNGSAQTKKSQSKPKGSANLNKMRLDSLGIVRALDEETAALLNKLTPEDSTMRSSIIYTTPSGLKYRIVREGTGKMPTAIDNVEVNYEGRFTDGKIFDSSYQRGESIEFPLNRVIRGWTEGVQLMPEGSVYEFYIPSELAYGSKGAGGIVPPDTPLMFKIHLIKVNSAAR